MLDLVLNLQYPALMMSGGVGVDKLDKEEVVDKPGTIVATRLYL